VALCRSVEEEGSLRGSLVPVFFIHGVDIKSEQASSDSLIAWHLALDKLFKKGLRNIVWIKHFVHAMVGNDCMVYKGK
jgi:hypothetical protein